MIRKFQNALGAAMAIFLSILPLAMKFVQEGLHIPVNGADTAQFNFVFLFSCFAGILTWRDGRHLGLASIFDNADERFRKAVEAFRNLPTAAILTALFFASWSQSFMMFLPGEKVWGVPLAAIFAILPLMYFSMLACSVAKNDAKVVSVVGIAVGVLISTGPISGVLYNVFQIGEEKIPLLYSITEKWQSFSSLAMMPLILFFVLCAFLGVPLFICISAVAYIAFSPEGYVEQLAMNAYEMLTDKSIAAIPLFTVAGYILSQGSAGRRLLLVFKSFFGSFRGGTVAAAVVVSIFFTTFTGISSVTILALGGILTTVLCGTGFKRDSAQSLITASGAVGLLFPPSVAIIMYGTVNFFSVDVFALFRAALVPGLMMAAGVIAVGYLSDKTDVRPSFRPHLLARALKSAVFELLMPALIIASFFSGFFSLMEAASFAVLYSFAIETFVRRDYDIRGAVKTIVQGIPVAGGVLVILASARGLSSYLIDAGVPQMVSAFVVAHVHSKYLFLLMINFCLLVVGCLMDIYSAILIVSPLIIPVADSFGINPLQMGVIFLMNLQIGFLTPPVGMDLFIASYAFDKSVMKVVKGVLPYLAVEFAILMLITYCPIFTSLI